MQLAGPIAEALERGATVIAASSRAARALHLGWAERQRNAGCAVWPTPLILDWQSWLRQLWSDHSFTHPEAPMLLSPLAELALWRRAQGADAAGVVSAEALAELASDAWSLLSQFGAHAARRHPWDRTDAEHFRQWASTFERECLRHNWLSASQLEEQLTAATDLSLPAELCLAGFDRMRPAGRRLLDEFITRGVKIEEASLPEALAERAWVVASSRREEIAECARWAREQLLRDPAARIAVIVPDLEKTRGEMERLFREVLMPESEDLREAAAAMPFEFSLGQPLAEAPAIRAALLLLRWMGGTLPEESISWLMLSGFVADTATKAAAIARHDAKHRDLGWIAPKRSLQEYRASLQQAPALRGLQAVLSELLKFSEANRLLDQRRSPSAWAELVPHLLERAGWPGLRAPDSVQFQAQQRWGRLLDELATLDFDGTSCSFEEFRAGLDRHARETIFAPESHEAPVQIMGPAESSGQQFDAVWFMGTDDSRWPARGRLHPLLPYDVQRNAGMPHAEPEDDWNLAHAITARLLASTAEIVFSYAQREKDAELRPSPLIASLFPPGAEPHAAEARRRTLKTSRPALEEIADDCGVLAWPRELVAGGADVLRRQAACPFQSFAIRRLAAEPLEENDWGFSAADRGNLLHKVMERLFAGEESRSLRSREEIVTAIGTNRIGEILDAHIEAVLTECAAAQPDDAWTRNYLAAEKRRLRTRIAEWLSWEAKRQPFNVEGCEQRLRNVEVGELRMNLRADRIDLLPDGSRLLLDYKTGDVSPAAWQGDRPEEPQLPLYAAFGNVENLSGVLFAQIRAGSTGFQGRVRDAKAQLLQDGNPKTALVRDPYNEAMRQRWARTLENLADEFLHGEAAVAPRDAKVCDQCELHGLCRIAAMTPTLSSASEEDTHA